MKTVGACVAALALASCATPYQDMGFLGGVSATRIDSTTVQVTARGNAYTDADTIQRYVLRKAAEETIAAGFDGFEMSSSRDRSRTGRVGSTVVTGSGYGAFATNSSWQVVKPGESVMVRMFKGPKPADAPLGVYDAREVLRYMTESYTPPGPRQ